jgi:hypothetical protein
MEARYRADFLPGRMSLPLKRALPTRDIRPFASYFYGNPGHQHFVQRVSHRKAHGFEWQPPVSRAFSRPVVLCERAVALSLNRLSWFRCLPIPSALPSVSVFCFLSLSDPAISRHARTLAKARYPARKAILMTGARKPYPSVSAMKSHWCGTPLAGGECGRCDLGRSQRTE